MMNTKGVLPYTANCVSVGALHAVLTHHWSWQWRAGIILSCYAFLPAPLVGFHRGLSDSAEPDCLVWMPFQGGTMLIQTKSQMTTHFRVVEFLIQIRQEWEQVAQERSLIEIRGSVGLLLADFTSAIGLTPEEEKLVFGPKLTNELFDFVFPSCGRTNGL